MSITTRTDVVVGDGYLRYKEHGFDTIDFISPTAHAEYIEPHKNDNSYKIVKSIPNEKSFYGASDMASVVELTRVGDVKATASLLDGLKEISSEGDSNTGVTMGTEGVAYDMGSVVSGEPECCITMDNPDTKRCIEIVIDLGYSGGTSSSVINYRSIGIVNLVATLQAQGYIVSLYAMSVYPRNKCAHRVKINTETFCISQLASVTSTAYWRCIGWMTVEIMRDKKSNGGADGSVMSKDMQKSIKDSGTFYIGGGYTDNRMNSLKNGADATTYVAELFNKYCASFSKQEVGV